MHISALSENDADYEDDDDDDDDLRVTDLDDVSVCRVSFALVMLISIFSSIRISNFEIRYTSGYRFLVPA